MELYSSKKEKIIPTVMPNDKSDRHHETHEISLQQAEHIVAARIDVDKEDWSRPCVICLLLYKPPEPEKESLRMLPVLTLTSDSIDKEVIMTPS